MGLGGAVGEISNSRIASPSVIGESDVQGEDWGSGELGQFFIKTGVSFGGSYANMSFVGPVSILLLSKMSPVMRVVDPSGLFCEALDEISEYQQHIFDDLYLAFNVILMADFSHALIPYVVQGRGFGMDANQIWYT